MPLLQGGYTTKRWGEKTCHRINEEDKGCPEGMKWLSNENGEGYCIKDTPCPRMYYSRDGSAPCMRCPEGTTTFTTGAKYCSDEPDEPSTDDNTTDDYTDDAPYDDDETHNSENVEKCPYGTMWVEKDSEGLRPLCKLDYYSETGASPCEECLAVRLRLMSALHLASIRTPTIIANTERRVCSVIASFVELSVARTHGARTVLSLAYPVRLGTVPRHRRYRLRQCDIRWRPRENLPRRYEVRGEARRYGTSTRGCIPMRRELLQLNWRLSLQALCP